MNNQGITKRTKQIFMYCLAIVVVVGFAALSGITIWLVFTGQGVEDLSQNMVLLIGGLFGTWQSAFIMLMSFFFGSSQGSADKTEIMADGNSKALNTPVAQ